VPILVSGSSEEQWSWPPSDHEIFTVYITLVKLSWTYDQIDNDLICETPLVQSRSVIVHHWCWQRNLILEDFIYHYLLNYFFTICIFLLLHIFLTGFGTQNFNDRNLKPILDLRHKPFKWKINTIDKELVGNNNRYRGRQDQFYFDLKSQIPDQMDFDLRSLAKQLSWF
jgi:hypothetical protein